MSFDLSDPNTWPQGDDIDALTNIANGDADVDDGSPKPNIQQQEPAPEPVTEPEVQEPEVKEPEVKEPEADTQPVEEPPEDNEPQQLTLDGIPIATKDGKHFIPFDVLAKHRSDASTYKSQLDAATKTQQELQRQLDALKSATPPAAYTPSAPAYKKPQLPDDDAVEARVKKLEEDWGPEIAQQYRDLVDQQRLVAQLLEDREAETQRVQELKQALDMRTKMDNDSREVQIQDAIDHNPTLLKWQTDEDGTWFERSVQLYRFLQQNDTEFAKLPITQQFAKLPERVKGVYPDAPLVEQAPGEQEIRAAAAKKAAEVPARTPVTHSDLGIPGDTATDSIVQQVDKMSADDLTNKFMNMSSDERMAFLAALS